MDFTSQHNDFVDPNDLFTFAAFADSDPPIKTEVDFFDIDTTLGAANMNGWTNPSNLHHTHQDSAVDLRGFYARGHGNHPHLKTEDSSDLETFLPNTYSPAASNASNTPSPHGDMIFSNSNSPGDYNRDQSQTSSPEADIFTQNSIMIPQQIETHVMVDKNKTRAETQIKTTLVVHNLPRQYQWARFPRHTLSKSKQLAGPDEIEANESGDAAIRVDLTLVCATAVDKVEDMERALRRARGVEKQPRRRPGTQVSDIDKEDEAHPQNGGAVVICEGCKERERKRYDRKKKRNQEEENEWSGYEDDRIIMINEKEFKRWQDSETSSKNGAVARKVEFAMRITCYCRHQEEKSPVGYKVIFTFRDTKNNVLNQMMSEVIQITDDHKNRELPVVGTITTDLNIPAPPPSHDESMRAQYNMGMYSYPPAPVYDMYSQPTTPVLSQFPSQLSPMDGSYQGANTNVGPQVPHQSSFTYGAGSMVAPTPAPAPSYASHQRYQSYSNTPILSPTEQFASQAANFNLARPNSMDNFTTAFASMYPHPGAYAQPFASQPQSRNVSRPASPSWDQGPSRAKKIRGSGGPGFFIGDGNNE